MAVEQHVAVIALTQLLRTVLMHDDYRPTLQDMPNWERIGEWVDDVRLLHRDEYYHIVGGKRDLMEVLATECGQSNLPDLQLSCLMWEISFTMMRDYEDPKLFPMEEDAFYGSHWNEMLWVVSSLSRMDVHTIHNGESNKLDDGQTWAEGPLRVPQFEHICDCYLVHALCTHLRYSIPDLLRMTTYTCERSMWEMSEAEVD
jgi:hypothetical protein